MEVDIMRKEYALEVRTKGEDSRFLYQIDVLQSISEAKALMLECKNNLSDDEEFDIRCIEYDDNEEEITSYSIF